MKIKQPLIFTLIILFLLSLVGTCMLYSYLPTEVAIHFNDAGVADGFAPRYMIFGTTCMPLLIIGLIYIIPRIDPRKESYTKHSKVYITLMCLTALFLIIIHWITLLINLGIAIPVEKVIPFGVGILFIVIGNYLPRIRSNYTLGIRTPWALEDASNWQKTQRVGGYMFILAGILFIGTACFSSVVASWVFVPIILLTIFVPILVSYLEYRKNH